MIFKRVFLEKDNETVYLDAYVADPLPDFTRKAILIVPGGGYSEVCSVKEGEAIGQAIILPYATTEDDVAEGERVGGFGSTNG